MNEGIPRTVLVHPADQRERESVPLEERFRGVDSTYEVIRRAGLARPSRDQLRGRG